MTEYDQTPFVVADSVSSGSSEPALAELVNGGFVAAWTDEGGQVNVQRLSPSAALVGSLLSVSDTSQNEYQPLVTGLTSGGFVVSWIANDPNSGSNVGAFAQVFSGTGVAAGPVFQLGTGLGNLDATSQWELHANPSGGFVFLGQTDSLTPLIQVFDEIGVPTGPATSVAVDFDAEIAFLDNGNFVLCGTYRGENGTTDVKAQIYSPDGHPLGNSFLVNTTTQYGQENPDIAVLADGSFVVVWTGYAYFAAGSDSGGPVVGSATFAQAFTASGSPIGGEIRVSSETTMHVAYSPSVVADLDGGFLITWNENKSGPGGTDEDNVLSRHYSARFDASPEFILGDPAGNESYGDSVRLTSGDAAIAWLDGPSDQVSIRGVLLTSTAQPTAITGSAGPDSLVGTQAVDLLRGYQGDDTLDGRAGRDLLDGGPGIDTMRGGAGNDTYRVDNTADRPQELANEGTDTVESLVSFALGDNLENLMLVGSEATRATGNALRNTLRGNTGSNILDGGAAADILIGGEGSDTYFVDNSGDRVVEGYEGGVDTVISTLSFALVGAVENLTLTGSAIRGTGNALANRIVGNASSNILDGGAGADIMRGGLGNDSYFVDSTGDSAIENAGEGTDTVSSSVSFTIGANIENLTITGSAVRGNGNSLANTINGNGANNILNGGAGADTMRGGLGDDIYYVDNAGDSIVESAGGGRERVYTTISLTLGSNLEDVFMRGSDPLNATGNGLDNVLRGNSAANVLTGGAGADDYRGGTGGDTFVFNNGDFAGLTPSTSDRIIDFSHAEGDHINLAGVDANSATGGDQAFAFIGTAAFHHTAGELRYEITNGNTYLTGDTNGDGLADFMVRLDGSHTLVSGDFIL